MDHHPLIRALPPRGARRAVASTGAFVRATALGGTLVMILLGALSASPRATLADLGIVLLVGVSFHVFAFVLNDVVDLAIDRGEPRRASSPLVRGVVSPRIALAVALAQVPISLALVGGSAGREGVASLVVAFAGLGAYDVLGKRCPVPPLTDLVQGAGWGALVVCGATLVPGRTTSLTWVLTAYVAIFIVQANGVHGAIRDLENDDRHGVRSTARWMGAEPLGGGRVRTTPALRAYAIALQVILLAILAQPFVWGGLAGSSEAVLLAGLGVAGLGASSCRYLLRAMTASDARSLLNAGFLHLWFMLALPIALVLPGLDVATSAAIVAIYLVPVLGHAWFPDAVRWAVGSRAATVDAT